MCVCVWVGVRERECVYECVRGVKRREFGVRVIKR